MAGLLDMTGFLTPLVQKLVDFIPDPLERAKAQAAATTEMVQFVASQQSAQLQVDQAEASNPSVFVAGWRPAVGWVGVAALAWSYVALPIIATVRPEAHVPVIDTSTLWDLIAAMLGIGGMRTFEKMKGVDTKGVSLGGSQ